MKMKTEIKSKWPCLLYCVAKWRLSFPIIIYHQMPGISRRTDLNSWRPRVGSRPKGCKILIISTAVFLSKARISTRLQQYRAKAELSRNTRPQAWVPREKLPRPLTSSASAIRKLMRKAELMGISTDIFPVDTSDTNASMDGRRKHKQPALTADFVNYYLGEKYFHLFPLTVIALLKNGHFHFGVLCLCFIRYWGGKKPKHFCTLPHTARYV